MLITNHVLAGAVVGHVVPGPVSAFAVGVASHFAMDAVPHWGDGPLRNVLHIAVVDGLVGGSLLLLVARATSRERRTTAVAGMLGAAFPDSDKPWDLFIGGSPFPAGFDRFHAGIQTESPRRLPQEFLVAGTLGLVVRRVLRRTRDELPGPLRITPYG
ncbi:MAG: hypothetical protein ABIQ59_04215 [Nocardioidaceae bacterium]